MEISCSKMAILDLPDFVFLIKVTNDKKTEIFWFQA